MPRGVCHIHKMPWMPDPEKVIDPPEGMNYSNLPTIKYCCISATVVV